MDLQLNTSTTVTLKEKKKNSWCLFFQRYTSVDTVRFKAGRLHIHKQNDHRYCTRQRRDGTSYCRFGFQSTLYGHKGERDGVGGVQAIRGGRMRERL
jgi:hypothetical protein